MDRFVIHKKPRVERSPPNADPVSKAAEEEGEEKEESDSERENREGARAEVALPEHLVDVNTASTATATSSTPSDLSQTPAEGPRRPVLRRYPATRVGQQDRFFNRKWYEENIWLEYSILKDCAFCFACRHFSRVGSHGEKAAFIQNGYHNWRKATEQPVELKRLSDTRWSCQYSALWAVQKTLPVILAILKDIKLQPHARRSTDARALLSLIDEEFILHLILFEDLFRTAKFMSDTLQSPNLLLETATDLAYSVITTIKEKRTEDTWRAIWSKAKGLCAKVGVAPQKPPHERRQSQPPHHLQDFIVEAPIETEHPTMSSPDALRTSSFYPVIDRLVNEMTRRFSTEAGAVLTGTSALNPKHATFLQKESLFPMAQHYGIREDNLLAEIHQVHRLLERKEEQGVTVSSTRVFGLA
ncbi:hypothetical protein SKAU_G00018940 [Synaphobranchus kaupii]|uniref:TTF-type domain-containing protein n=1 Tax=Synaphobranchus kaupii TaxID=118154 RepID=A0A9Q1JC05_SYNKA|nr:hypothetical protein SKAU_G00018940 [Synaphobranchus kaupii]